MYYLTIDDLMEEVNRIVQLPNQEDMRVSVIRNVVTVYRKVNIIDPMVVEFMTVDTKGKTVILPETTYKVHDVGYSNQDYSSSFDSSSMRFYDQVSYRIHGNKIRFSTDLKGVSIALVSLPKDENGLLLIDDRIYDACVNYCAGQELLIKSSNVKQDYATMNPAMVFIQQGKSLIDEARAGMNETSPGEYRRLERELRRQH